MVSEATRKAMRIAVLEAHESSCGDLKSEHILLGLLSLDKLVVRGYDEFKKRGEVGSISADHWWSFHAENMNLNEIYRKFDMKPIVLRECIHSYLATNTHCTGRSSEKLEIPIADHRWNKHQLMEQAYSIAHHKGHPQVNTLHLLIALMDNPGKGIREVLGYVDLTKLRREAYLKLDRWLSPHKPSPKPQRTNTKINDQSRPKLNKYIEDTHTPYLADIGTNLTVQALESKIEPLIGRENELIQLIQTLNRKKKNNPLLVGESGVGKTALVRALAQRIVDGQVPEKLKNKRIYEIDVNTLISGTRYRGDMEYKIKRILREARTPDVIIFIDEFHTVLGAGASDGTILDVSNIIKPALGRGELNCIAATTISEYRRYVERDQALARRFQTLIIEEPSPEEAHEILRGLRPDYQEHYQVKITDDAIKVAVDLSVRYLHHKKLPDKALDVLDDACSLKTINNHGESVKITARDVAKAVEIKSGVPIEMDFQERDQILQLDEKLQQLVVGQDEAIRSVSKRLKIARAGLKDPKRPLGVFLFLGPTGVGKTLLAKSLARVIFGREEDLIRLDMSEYMDPGSLSKLIGAPPGFIGADEGQLSGALRTKPYSVVLLDEMEKAHPKIFDLFLQVFDEGFFTDGKGIRVDARSCIFIMTSNLTFKSSDYEAAYGITAKNNPPDDKIRQGLLESLRPELLNRIDEVILFKNLKIRDMKRIAWNMIQEICRQTENLGMKIEVENNALEYLSRQGYHSQFGARPLRREIEDQVKYPLSEMILKGQINKGDKIRVKLEKNRLKMEKSDLSMMETG